ncbi:electron transfer flavoprotein subunit alpha/FixB family protein [Sphingobium aquiterrae]|uniref:electron transfer flavoprotein subunit alpha/FixB family protein n=1 Tax=Sphingobium aquiterrae TaxID=2038656 RepID=UPI003016D7D2
MKTLLIADHDNQSVADGTARALTAARALGGEVDILIAGLGAGAAANAAAKLQGVSKVLLADGEAFAHALAEPLAALVLSIAGGYGAIVAPASSSGKNVLPRIAARLDVMQVSDVTRVAAPDIFEHPIYAGNAIEVVKNDEPVKLLTIRTSAFAATSADGAAAPVETIAAAIVEGRATFEGEALAKSDRPELGSAKIVVSGGRALGSPEKFDAVILPLADRLHAAVGASRAAVDAGYAPNDFQVGQTGKIVAPDLYVALGISGAIQHLAGMKDSKVIVAVNKDEDAPIFQVADFGLVGDLFQLVPEIEAALG